MKIVKTTIDELIPSRADYLNSLPEFQELYLELMIQHADCYHLVMDDIEVGHVIESAERVLLEYYVKNRYIPQSHEYFSQIIEQLGITNIYCKSFDSILLSNCLLSSFPYSILGVLYRDYQASFVPRDHDLIMSPADRSSIRFLLEQDDSIHELFETETQLSEFIDHEYVFLFYKNGDFVGCGMVLRTNSDWDYCDLGVWVNPLHRCHGIGSQIILSLREFALNHHLHPSCGCAIENIASQKMIEKSGFVSKHKLINFKTNTEREV